MDGWERSKIYASVAGALLLIGTGWWFSGMVVSPVYPEQRGYAVEGIAPVDLAGAQRAWPAVAAHPGERAELLGYIRNIDKASLPVSAAGPAAPEVVPDLGTLLAAADPEKGRRSAQVCGSCHTMEAGGANRVGPNLWAVVGKPVASHGGFGYSPALAGQGGQWTYQALDAFLASPTRAVPGTKMTYAGLRNPRDRANLLAYLATLGPSRPPFPPPAAAPSAGAGPLTPTGPRTAP